jgi:phosphate transport system substrate-binding protein
VEDSLTSGRILIVCASEASALISRERDAFVALYPEATIEVRSGPSREAIRTLFGAEADLGVITRELEPAERVAASRGGLELEGYRFARDALVMVVHPGNRVENLALEELRRIYDGRAVRWSELGGPALEIEPVIQAPESDITEFFVQQVMNGQPIRARARYAASDSEVVDAVARRAGAVGYVSLAWADRGARALRLASLTGLPYRRPDLETVYGGEYPLTRFLSLYARPDGPRLANGFITYVTSIDGQRIVRESGLVPTTVPVRFVRRSGMQSTH